MSKQSLGSIEDKSFLQSGVIQTLSIIKWFVSVPKEENKTDLFVANPRKQIVIINNAIEDFKNGRPVCDD